ncbi:MAG TPA: bifunctional phosphoribosylaminoimidazolecarboxamide formyltransferase/inosine monophosphate cyclohydrolase, partial [Elusimicrobia bacterium]|nr:bifunctional phosphoribosylaminoimidazolecarboxamide formyltransferase/inosine monophosphate cyclohydrolase [Elusimicrobiota bacterium]
MSKVKRALVSVSDKIGIVEFAKELAKMDVEIISTGGTAKALREAGLKVKDVSEVTGFPEMLDGRVKTLHPKVHAGLLALRDNPEHQKQIKEQKIEPIDMVVVNLYPFEKVSVQITRKGTQIPAEVIENIDIGGPSMLRSAAKNFKDVIVITDPNDYAKVLEEMKNNQGEVTLETKQYLATKVFQRTAAYDSAIANYFTTDKFPGKVTLSLEKINDLRYGENPHQKAAIYQLPITNNQLPNLTGAKQLQGKELSYNNWLDLESAYSLVLDFENPACVIVKHNNPCGVAEAVNSAQGGGLLEAYKNAYACDTVSAFGGIIGLNREVDEKTAEEIKPLFVECIIAPGFSAKAKEIFSKKKDLRLLELPITHSPSPIPQLEFRQISGGMLVQDKDTFIGSDDLKVVTTRKASEEELESLKFAWKVAKAVKSNTIVLAEGKQTFGMRA